MDVQPITSHSARPVSRAWRLFAIVALAALTIPRMTQIGIFGDGLIYATVAHNLSQGVGTPWSPAFSAKPGDVFFETPPVGLWLNALAFVLLGSSAAVERVYSLAVFGLTAGLVMALWRRLQPPEYDWLPLIFWALPSIVTWATVNNMLEPTQTLFTTAAVFAVLVAMRTDRTAVAIVLATASGVAVMAAFLTKGPVGFYPLITPGLAALVLGMPAARRAGLVTATMVVTLAMLAAGIALYEPARLGVSTYFEQQLFPAFRGVRDASDDPFAAFRHLGLGILARMAVLTGLVALFARGLGTNVVRIRPVLFFGLAGLSASLPIALSAKVTGHYFLPSAPLFALTAAAVSLGSARRLVERPSPWPRRVPVALALALALAAVFIVAVRGSAERRDEALLEAVFAVGRQAPRGAIIGACEATATDWHVQGYLNRHFRVSVEASGRPVNGWFLEAGESCVAPASCTVVVGEGALTLLRCPADSPVP